MRRRQGVGPNPVEERAAPRAAEHLPAVRFSAMAVLALQRQVGNAAVGRLLGSPAADAEATRPVVSIQRYRLVQEAYSPHSSHGDDAYEARVKDGVENVPEVNYAVLYEGGRKFSAGSRGPELHSEPLLIGQRLHEQQVARPQELDGAQSGLAALGRYNSAAYARGDVFLYTERRPCTACEPKLNAALRPTDTVAYSVPWAGGTDLLRPLLHEAGAFRGDEEALRQVEQEAADMEEGDRIAAESRRQALYPYETDEPGRS